MSKNAVDWRYKLDSNYSWESRHPMPEDVVFRDKRGTVRLIMSQAGTITVTRGYSWDGCTPKFRLWDFSLGIPDGVVHKLTGQPKTYYASLVHDVCYQFLPDGLKLERVEVDRFFLVLMKDSDFGPRYIYWLAVRAFGGLFRRAMRVKRGTKGEALKVGELLEPREDWAG
jgi:hypothetical protein